jgi:hypothetical protein
MSKRKRVWNVTFVNKEDEVIDRTQIDEKSAKLAWDLFGEFGHTKENWVKIKWEKDWELFTQ